MADFVCDGCGKTFTAQYNNLIPFQLNIGKGVLGYEPGKKYFCKPSCVHEYTRNEPVKPSPVVTEEEE